MAPPPPAVAPLLPDVASIDRNGDRIDDLLLKQGATDDDERVTVEAIFSIPITSSQLRAFVAGGGVLRHVFRAVSYGFTGTLPRSSVSTMARALGPSLLLLQGSRPVTLHLDEATSTGRARPVWAANFAGSATGFSGSPTINIGFLDTGIDAAHPDLAGRMIGWKDYSSEGLLTPQDREGHGSFVAGIALGSGASFGVGPGTLRYTDSDLAFSGVGGFWQNPIHLPATFAGVFTSTATWQGGGTTDLVIVRNKDGETDPYDVVAGPTTGASPLVVTWNGPGMSGTRVSAALKQSGAVGPHAIANTVTSYPAVGDGLPALRGVASLSHWYFAKIFPASGQAQSTDINAAMDDIVAQSVALNIKVVNMSFGISPPGFDATVRAKANTMVANGIVVVASNGNLGPNAQTADPGRAASVITVGASNDLNELTEYTSGGFAATSPDEDYKLDILAPGGSLYRSRLLSVDANTTDAKTAGFADVQANDYTNISGTSVAAPFISGAAALVIGALEKSGTPWVFGSTTSPYLVKMLLLASATETNAPREIGATSSPALGRSTTPKDLYEGYGIVNPDAAVEAAALAYDSLTSFTASTLPETPSERRAWGRHITVPAGTTLTLSLAVPSTADYDLYLYSATPGPNGNPVILLAADHAPLGESEPLTWTPTATTNAYLIIKRVSGHGAFTLTGCVCDADAGATCFGSLPPCIPPPPPPVEAGPPPAVDGGTDPNAGIDSGVGPGGEAPPDEGCDCKSATGTSSSSPRSSMVLAAALALASILRRRRDRGYRPPN